MNHLRDVPLSLSTCPAPKHRTADIFDTIRQHWRLRKLMISRTSTRLLSYLYFLAFSDALENSLYGGDRFDEEGFKAFLYENDYEPWFLRLEEDYFQNEVEPDDLILGLHTGDTFRGHAETEEAALRLGQEYLLRLTKDIMPFVVKMAEEEVRSFNSEAKRGKEAAASFLAQLELDGYAYRNGKLYPIESAAVDAQAEQSYLESLVDSLTLSDSETIKHHIQLAEEHYINGRHSDSIGNSRHFLEAILSQVLEKVVAKLGRSLNPVVYKNATDVRTHLEREGLISADERDTLKQVYGLLSNTGGHAYIAQKDQARLMWNLALTFSQYVLLRYEGFLQANP
jgi:hypothetical protein